MTYYYDAVTTVIGSESHRVGNHDLLFAIIQPGAIMPHIVERILCIILAITSTAACLSNATDHQRVIGLFSATAAKPATDELSGDVPESDSSEKEKDDSPAKGSQSLDPVISAEKSQRSLQLREVRRLATQPIETLPVQAKQSLSFGANALDRMIFGDCMALELPSVAPSIRPHAPPYNA